ncbi:hypothetical protein [Massilia sp. S19_KUP03_FR1]|uniref:hypothetical protein n=1 Tax=Massilia sp. S19_KUP03_FR1 TaxID=3025503 RepID=UPI002FCD7843
MPSYSVWYRNNPEPLEFATAYRCTDVQIVDHILEHESISRVTNAATHASVTELITSNELAPVRYTEDESEMNTIE